MYLTSFINMAFLKFAKAFFEIMTAKEGGSNFLVLYDKRRRSIYGKLQQAAHPTLRLTKYHKIG